MLIVRPEQLKAFQTTAESAFVRRVTGYLRENHPDAVIRLPSGEHEVQALDDETLQRMVCTGLAHARTYGLTWESSLTSYVVLMFVVAPNFDRHPLIRRALSDEKIEPDLRLEGIWEKTTEENWEVAEQNYDVHAWNLESGEMNDASQA